MALTKCPECGNEVSTQADSCPKCGYKLNENTKETDGTSNSNSEWVQSNQNVPITKKPKKKHGCLSSIIVFIVICCLLAKCMGGDDGDNKSDSANEQSTTTEQTGSEEQKTLEYKLGNVYSGNKCKFNLTKGDENGFTLRIKNRSKKDYNFCVHSMAINGIMTNCNIYTSQTDIPSKKKGDVKIEFEDDWLEGIDNIEYVDFIVWAYDNAKSYKDFETGIIRIKTNYFSGQKKFKAGKGSKKDQSLVIQKEKLDTDTFEFSVINKNKKYVEFDFDNSSINGLAFDDDYLFDVKDVVVYPNSKTTLKIDISDFTDESNINKIKNVEFSLTVRPRGDYFNEKETKKIRFK